MIKNQHDLIFKNEVYAIVGAAIEVSNKLGSGFLEAVYQEALYLELTSRGIPTKQQVPVKINYKGKILQKKYIADFLYYDQILVEIKAIKSITVIEEAQILNYLNATGYTLGLIINFGNPKLDWERYIVTQRDGIRLRLQSLKRNHQ